MSYDYNIIVIGAGAGGLVSSYIAAAVKAKVLLIEKKLMGGDCLNYGCVPSKALIRSAKLLHQQRRSAEFGLIPIDNPQADFAAVMKRVHQVIAQIAPHDSVERYTELGVECLAAEAKITGAHSVEANGKTFTARSIILATGAAPITPSFDGLDQVDWLSSDTLWHLKELPKKLLILGGGPIGCEMAQAFARLGSHVTIVEMAEQILIREDIDTSIHVTGQFTDEGIEVHTGLKAKSFRRDSNGRQWLLAEQVTCGSKEEIEFDKVLITLGRKARTQGFGLEELGVKINPNGTMTHDAFLRTSIPSIYVCGDLAGPYQFTHTAAHQAWYAAANALFSPLKKFKADYSVIPWVTFTDPEIARVGLNELDAKEQNIAYEITIYNIDDLDRAICEGEAHGLIKVLTVPGKDKILGVTIVAAHAGELLSEYTLAMKHGLGLKKILGTIHPYPTMSEANKYAAGNWQKNHQPEFILKLLKKFHRWRRR